MGLDVYICPEGFPARIPEILRADGFEVSTAERRGQNLLEVVGRDAFAFEVRQGGRVLRIRGSTERDGMIGFLMGVEGSICTRGYFGARRFYDAVESSLLKAGAREFTAADHVSDAARR